MLRSAFVLIAIAVCSFSVAQKQTRPNYKLLWKISGKGLQKPSYIFGTIHVQEKKAFDFSDSVLLKLEECEAFALEIHPDSVTAFMVQALLNRAEHEGDFKKSISDAEYKRLDSLMKKKSGFSLKNFKSPAQANIFLQERSKNKDTNTFLDAWLYNIARNQNKTMLGLEEYSVQLALLKNSEEETEELKNFLESSSVSYAGAFKSLLDLYHAGSIDAIRKFLLDNTDDDNYEQLITSRNVIMAESIQNEIHKHSTFIAVGAGHLAGEEGLISLIKKAGYDVSPVTSSFTGLAAKYKVVKTEQKWFEFLSKDGGYALHMPQKPIPFAPAQVPITFQTSVDIGTLTAYMATHFPLGTKATRETAAETLAQLEKNISAKNRIYGRKNIKADGLEGRELELSMNDHFFRIQILLRESVVYLLMCGPSRDVARSEDANRFFTSFKTTELPKQVSEDFIHEQGAFAVRMSGNVTPRNASPADPNSGKIYKINMFLSSSTETGETYIFRYNDFPPGLVSINDSVYFSNTLQSLMQTMKAEETSSHAVTLDDFPGMQFTFSMPVDPNTIGEGLMALRGNRFYLALAVRGATTARDNIDQYFKSLKFLPYQKTIPKVLTFEGGASLKVPVGFEQDSALNKMEGATEYSFLDKNTGILYTLFAEEFSKYDQVEDTTEYLDSVIKRFQHETDSMTSSEVFNTNGCVGAEYWFTSSIVNTKRRIKLLCAGKKVYLLSAFLPRDYEQSSFTDEVFSSLMAKVTTDWNLFTDKTDLIFEDLKSSDSLTRERSLAAFRTHKFDSGHLPNIYQQLNRNYSDPIFETRARNAMLAKLSTVNDETTRSFIVKLYNQLPDTTESRDFALQALASLKTEEGVASLLTLIEQDASSRVFNNYIALENLRDSLELLNAALPRLLPLENRFEYSYTTFDLVKMALDSGVLTPEVKQKVTRQVLELARKMGEEPFIKKGADEFDPVQDKILNMVTLLTALPVTEDVKSLMLQFQKTKDVQIMSTTSVFLLQNNVPVPSADLDKIAEDPLYRFDLYESLNKIGKGSLINKKYLTVKMLAESDFYQQLWYDDGLPEKVEFVEERKMRFKGEVLSLFVFKYAYEESDEWYMGVSGPFNPKQKGLLNRGELSELFYDNYPTNKLLTERLTEFAKTNGGELVK